MTAQNHTDDFSPDVLTRSRQPLHPFFIPKTVAVVGATERPGSLGKMVLWNLISCSFGRTIFPVNPSRQSVLGIKTYAKIQDVPDKVDLAVIATPAESVPDIIDECAMAGVKGAIIISAGFKEVGPQGVVLEQKILERARQSHLRIIGPNCLGVMNPISGLNATFAQKMALPGSVGFISQSGALCTAILDWSVQAQVGFSAFVSIGSMLDVSWGDLIDYLGDDPRTESIVIYMESIGDARSFLSAAREVALTKPIIVLKAGRTRPAARAAASHTGSLTGSDEALDAAFRRCGVLRVDEVDELFYMAEVLSKQPRPKGPRLAILTNAGGPGVLATDTLINMGGELASLSEETINKLDQVLPAHWSRGNPVDIIGDAGPQRYADALEIISKDPNTDGLLVILTPQAMTDPTQTAEQLKPYGRLEDKPLLASWMGGAFVMAGVSILNSANIPTFPYPDLAVRAFHYMWKFNYNLQALYETPRSTESADAAPITFCLENVVEKAREAGRILLTESESKQLLSCYGIPCTNTRPAATPEEAVRIAEEAGYPVAVKVHSETLTHKAQVGGVRLNLADSEAVRKAYFSIQSSVRDEVGIKHFQGVTVQPMAQEPGLEIILGSSTDSQLGPVLLFGAGGSLVEIFKDRALGLPPLNTTLAKRMMERTQIYKALQGKYGNPPVDLEALEHLLVRFSQMVSENHWIKEIDINPLLVGKDFQIVLDARVILRNPDSEEDQLPKPAIRPYPVQYEGAWKMRDGTSLFIRPIRPDDEPLIIKFHEQLSDQSVYFYFFHPMKFSKRTSHHRLTRICFLDYDRQISLAANWKNPHTGEVTILGVVRLIKLPATNHAEFAMIISDPHQQKGLGTELLSRLLKIARDEKLDRISADILPENQSMQRICEKLGFQLRRSFEESTVRATLELN